MSFRAINWTPTELIGERKMDALSDNAQWLYNNTPRTIYTLPGGLRRVEGLKIASGRAYIAPRSSDTATVEVRFGNYFSSYCQPNVTTGIISNGQTKIFCAVNGIGTLVPDNRGFQIRVNIAATTDKNDKIARSLYVDWCACGF